MIKISRETYHCLGVPFHWNIDQRYHYAAIKLYQLGLDCATSSHGPSRISQRVLGGHGNIQVTAEAGIPTNGIEPPRVIFYIFSTMW